MFNFVKSWFLFFNSVAVAAIMYGYLNGHMDFYISGYTFPYAVPIILTFLLGWIISIYLYYQALKTNISDFRSEDKFKAWWNFKVRTIKWYGYLLIFLGLVGTILGFMHALTPDALSTANAKDADSIKTLLFTLMSGTGIALQTTFLGSVLGGVWLEVNSKQIENTVFKRWMNQ